MAETFETVWTATANANATLRLEENTRAWNAVEGGYTPLDNGHRFAGGELVVTGGFRHTDRADRVAGSVGERARVENGPGSDADRPWTAQMTPERPPHAADNVIDGRNPWPPPPPPPSRHRDFALEIEEWFHAHTARLM